MHGPNRTGPCGPVEDSVFISSINVFPKSFKQLSDVSFFFRMHGKRDQNGCRVCAVGKDDGGLT